MKKTSTREQIIDTAKTLIYHHGFGATSYGKISDATGIAKGNIQYHFNSKEELLRATVDKRLSNIATSLDHWSNNSNDAHGALSKFIQMVEKSAPDLARYGCPMGSLNDELGKDAPHLQIHTRQMFDIYLNWITAQFAREFDDPQARSHGEQLLSMAQGVSILAHGYNDAGIVERQAKFWQVWLDGLFGRQV